MAGYRIEKKPAGVEIELSDVGDKRDALLSAFNDCAEGRCSCPTNEHEKVASMTVEGGKDRIDIKLEAKADSEFQVSEIAYCLAHTIRTTDRKSTHAIGSAKEVTRGEIR